MREIILDTETTGLDPNYGHRVIEIGCIEMVHKRRTGRTFHTYLNPEREIGADAFRIHGLSTEFLQDKPLFASVSDQFLAFIDNATLVIHNAGFDLKFLNAELKRLQVEALKHTIIDTLQLARSKFPGAPASLDALCRRFGVDNRSRDKHGALLDAELLCDVYIELTGGYQTHMALEAQPLVSAPLSLDATETSLSIPAHPVRQFPPSSEELEAHQQFVTTIPNAIWLELAKKACMVDDE
jgi:DNA polymerase-3 subunit epsilon